MGSACRVSSADVGVDLDEPTSIIIPARALSELSRISAEQEDPIELIITPARNQILFHLTNTDLVSQLIEGNFPDYNQIIPKGHTHAHRWSARRSCSKRSKWPFSLPEMRPISSASTSSPATNLTPGQMIITGTSAEFGDNVSELDASIDGDTVEIAFNARYMIDALQSSARPRSPWRPVPPAAQASSGPLAAKTFCASSCPCTSLARRMDQTDSGPPGNHRPGGLFFWQPGCLYRIPSSLARQTTRNTNHGTKNYAATD